MKRLIPTIDLRVFPRGYVHTFGLSFIWVNGFAPNTMNVWDAPDEGLPIEVGIEVGILLLTFRATWELWIPKG